MKKYKVKYRHRSNPSNGWNYGEKIVTANSKEEAKEKVIQDIKRSIDPNREIEIIDIQDI